MLIPSRAPARPVRRLAIAFRLLLLVAPLGGCGDVAPTGTGEPTPPVEALAMSVEPLPALVPGDSARLVVTFVDRPGTPASARAVSYASLQGHIATVDASGVVHAVAAGTAELRIASDVAALTMLVTVAPEPVAAVRVHPRTITLEVGTSTPLDARAYDRAGLPLPGRAVAYRTMDGGVAGWTPHLGRLVATSVGTTELIAESGGAADTVRVQVVPVPAREVTISTQVTGAADARLIAAIGRAVQRWERALTTDLPDVEDSIAAGECGAGVPGHVGRIDDVHLFVVVDTIDGPGKVLASGGPCAVRSPSLLTYAGVVTLDRSDLAVLLSVGGMDDLLAHEIGHVLGIGVLWREGTGGPLVQAPVAGDPRFVGAAAREAAGRLGFHEEAARGIAVETRGGTGTSGVHWSESHYQRELMTGFLSGTGNPLSLITVLSLRDLGYGVAETAAEPYTAWDAAGAPTGMAAASAVRVADGAPLRLEERIARPSFTFDRTARRRTPFEAVRLR